MKRIAIFTPYALPEQGANCLRVESMQKHFEGNGFQVEVFAPERKGAEKKVKGYSRYKSVFDVPKIVFSGNFDLVLGTSPPLTHSFIAILSAKILLKKTVLDLRDPWTIAYEKNGIYSKTNPKLWLFKAMELLAYNIADRIFPVTKETGRIVSEATLNREKICVVWNGTDPLMFRRDEKAGKKARKELGIPSEAKVCLYAGSFEKKWVPEMVDAIAGQLKKNNAWLLFVIPLEKGAELERIKSAVSSNGLADFTRLVDSKKTGHENMYKYFSAADLGLDPLPKSMEDYCIPAKTYDYFACGLPVVAMGKIDGELCLLVEKNGLGWVSENWDGFAESLGKALGSNGLKVIGKKARMKAKNVFDRKFANEKVLEEIRNMT